MASPLTIDGYQGIERKFLEETVLMVSNLVLEDMIERTLYVSETGAAKMFYNHHNPQWRMSAEELGEGNYEDDVQIIIEDRQKRDDILDTSFWMPAGRLSHLVFRSDHFDVINPSDLISKYGFIPVVLVRKDPRKDPEDPMSRIDVFGNNNPLNILETCWLTKNR